MNMGRWSWCTKQAHFPTRRGLLKPHGLELQPPRNSCWQRRAPSADCLATRHPAENAAPMESCLDRTCMCWKIWLQENPFAEKLRPLLNIGPCLCPACSELVSRSARHNSRLKSIPLPLLLWRPLLRPRTSKNHKTSSTKHHLLCRVPKRGAEFKLSTRQCLPKMGAAPANFSGPPGESASIALLCGCDVSAGTRQVSPNHPIKWATHWSHRSRLSFQTSAFPATHDPVQVS